MLIHCIYIKIEIILIRKIIFRLIVYFKVVTVGAMAAFYFCTDCNGNGYAPFCDISSPRLNDVEKLMREIGYSDIKTNPSATINVSTSRMLCAIVDNLYLSGYYGKNRVLIARDLRKIVDNVNEHLVAHGLDPLTLINSEHSSDTYDIDLIDDDDDVDVVEDDDDVNVVEDDEYFANWMIDLGNSYFD